MADARSMCRRSYTGSMVFSPIDVNGNDSPQDDPDSWNDDDDDEDEEVIASCIESFGDDGDSSYDEMNADEDATATG